MQQKHALNSIEIKEQEILRGLLVLLLATILKGLYNEAKNIDQNYVLVPALLIICILFCVIYGINAFTTGNLVNNWANTQLYNVIFNYFTNKRGLPEDRAMRFTIRMFGVFTFSLAIVCSILLFLFNIKKINPG
jgi:hypothetical protein